MRASAPTENALLCGEIRSLIEARPERVSMMWCSGRCSAAKSAASLKRQQHLAFFQRVHVVALRRNPQPH